MLESFDGFFIAKESVAQSRCAIELSKHVSSKSDSNETIASLKLMLICCLINYVSESALFTTLQSTQAFGNDEVDLTLALHFPEINGSESARFIEQTLYQIKSDTSRVDIGKKSLLWTLRIEFLIAS